MLNFFLLIIIYSGIYALMALGQNMITGYTGLLSLCQAGFFAVGSYTTAILMTKFGWAFWSTVPVAVLLSAVIGVFIGLPTLRLKGDYLAIATLGFAEIIKNVINNWDSMTNGPNGINRISKASFLGLEIRSKYAYIILIWVFVVLVLLFFRRIAASRMGRALEAVREDEIAAQAMGINITTYKVCSFALGACSAGLAGCFQALYVGSVMPGNYEFMISIMVLCMVVLGGMGNFTAVVLGAFLIQFIDYLPKLIGVSNLIPPQFQKILFGVILVFMMIYRPQGILGRSVRKYSGSEVIAEKRS